MILGENIGGVYSKGREIQRVFSKGKLVWEKKNNDDIDYSVLPFTVKAIADDVSVKLRGDIGTTVSYKYSINGGSWIETDTSTTINIKKDDIVSYKGLDIYRCKIKGLSDIYGNIMSLHYDDNFIGQTVWLHKGTHNFFESSDIRNAHNLILPATTLASRCYSQMFYNCTSLTTAPELPATTLATECYLYMFYNCTSLTTAPELPATTFATACYPYMFNNCSNLNYIKCYTRYDMAYMDILYFAGGASPTGKLVCYEEVADAFREHIPSTWTVEYLN